MAVKSAKEITVEFDDYGNPICPWVDDGLCTLGIEFMDKELTTGKYYLVYEHCDLCLKGKNCNQLRLLLKVQNDILMKV